MAKSPPTQPDHNRGAFLPFAFGGTMLLSAILLFSVQPLVGKLLLPLLGGAPSVWNTVMVFFQAMLLAGYAYAHWSFQALGLRWQPWLHVLILLLAALQLPFTIPEPAQLAESANPALWVLLVLTRAIGLPVFILASTAPLLQQWFACTSHASARDPYFLYAASNIGSFGALFAYPLLLEPYLALRAQTTGWGWSFWALAICILGCALLGRRWQAVPLAPTPAFKADLPRLEKPPAKIVWQWIGLSFVPSSLMLGVTNYITTDVASLPLLWVLPLGLYLFTFVIAFGRHSHRAEEVSSRAVPILALAAVFPMLVRATEPVWVFVLVHLLFFLFAALQCHLRLARKRPAPEHLTAFYLYLSLGGVLGGIFNALLAPLLFSSVAEYPLMILVATFVGFPLRAGMLPTARLPAIYGGVIVVIVMSVGAALQVVAGRSGSGAGNLIAALFLVAAYLFFRTPVRYTLALAVILFFTARFQQAESELLVQERNFFGVLRVTNHPDKPLRQLFHGTTIHGVQSTVSNHACRPLSYYHPEGPVGAIDSLFLQQALPPSVGLVGLGAGAMVAYAQPGQVWTLYEIDPAVVRIARDPEYFTYLSGCADGAELRYELGDARLKLQNAPEARFGLLYIDAFSSDVIPMHLLTLEAFQLYRSRLAPDGILALHISSRHFSLEGLVANLAKETGQLCYRSRKDALADAATEEGGIPSQWVIVVPPSYEAALGTNPAWKQLAPDPSSPLWTDDFSSLAGVLSF